MGEFGGHGWLVEGHQWDPGKRNWGYGGLPETIDEYIERYEKSMAMAMRIDDDEAKRFVRL